MMPFERVTSVMITRALSRILLALVLLVAPAVAWAQVKPATDPARQLKSLQEQLDLTRKQRLELEARLEKELASEIAQRAQLLAMGGEIGALQRLEQLLDSAQARLLVQRDRIRLLGDAARTPGASVLVVLLRMEQVPPGEVGAALMLDGQSTGTRTISTDQTKTLTAGAAEELYRGEVPSSTHKVFLQVSAQGINVGTGIDVPAAPQQVTYVEFTLRGGTLVASTWTSIASSGF
jgi:hypothetical protein